MANNISRLISSPHQTQTKISGAINNSYKIYLQKRHLDKIYQWQRVIRNIWWIWKFCWINWHKEPAVVWCWSLLTFTLLTLTLLTIIDNNLQTVALSKYNFQSVTICTQSNRHLFFCPMMRILGILTLFFTSWTLSLSPVRSV